MKICIHVSIYMLFDTVCCMCGLRVHDDSSPRALVIVTVSTASHRDSPGFISVRGLTMFQTICACEGGRLCMQLWQWQLSPLYLTGLLCLAVCPPRVHITSAEEYLLCLRATTRWRQKPRERRSRAVELYHSACMKTRTVSDNVPLPHSTRSVSLRRVKKKNLLNIFKN